MDHIVADNLREIEALILENENLRERARALSLDPQTTATINEIYGILGSIRRNKDQIDRLDLDIQHGEVFGVPHPG